MTGTCATGSTNTVSVASAPTVPTAFTITAATPSCGATTALVSVDAVALNTTYSISPSAGTTNNNDGTFTAPVSSGPYTITASSTLTGTCTTGSTNTVSVASSPIVPSAFTITAASPACGATTALVSVDAVALNTTYSISPSAGTTNNNDGTFTAPVSSGPYTITASSTLTGTCTTGSTNTVSVASAPAIPSAPIGSNIQFFCSIPSEPTLGDLVANGTSVNWYSASTGGIQFDPTVKLVDNTHYYASQTNISGCESASRLDVLVHLSNLTVSKKSAIKPYCGHSDGNIVVQAQNGIGNYSYTWNEGTLNDTISKIGVGNYTVIATDSIGCTAKLIVEISCKYADIPQVVSANGNGKNETWVIHADPTTSVQIYNRWGSLVYSALPYNDDWYGQTNVGATIGDEALPSGTYFYMIDNKDGEKPLSGYIELIK